MKGGIFTRRVEVHNLGLKIADNQMFISGVHSQPTQHDLNSTGLIA
jgi:hypothetical protein